MKKEQYKHSEMKPGFKFTNLARTLQLARSILGENYKDWFNDKQKLQEIFKIAHENIYQMKTSYKKNKGLQHQFDFLFQADRQSKLTKTKRNSYGDVAAAALAVNLVDQSQYKKMVA